MADWLRFGLSALFTLLGLFILVTAVLGVFRFRHSLSRIHAAALVDTIGILCMLIGLIIAVGADVASLKMLALIAFLWLTSPVSSHLIGRLVVACDDKLAQAMDVTDPAMVEREKEGD